MQAKFETKYSICGHYVYAAIYNGQYVTHREHCHFKAAGIRNN